VKLEALSSFEKFVNGEAEVEVDAEIVFALEMLNCRAM
jgi:hypothetical protein